MDDRSRRADAFYTVSGVLGIAAGPILMARGAPAGWSLLLVAAGLTLLSMQWVIVNDVEVDFSNPRHVLTLLAGFACVAVAAVYLTRAANDLPPLFPGRDSDSEQFRIVPGITALMVGLVVFGRGVVSALPARASR